MVKEFLKYMQPQKEEYVEEMKAWAKKEYKQMVKNNLTTHSMEGFIKSIEVKADSYYENSMTAFYTEFLKKIE